MNKTAVMMSTVFAVFAAVADTTIPVKNGLLFDLDAKEKTSKITVDESGYVTEWRTSAYDPDREETLSGVAFKNVTTDDYSNKTYYCPVYDDDGFDGRGAVKFGYALDGSTQRSTPLRSSTQFQHRTVFVVAKIIARPTSGWVVVCGGDGNFDLGIYNNNGTGQWCYKSNNGGNFWVDGDLKYDPDATNTTATCSFVNNAFTVLETETSESMAANKANCRMALGAHSLSYLGESRYLIGEIAEFLAYDRVLTEAERLSVTDYLRRRWSFVSDAPVTDGLVCNLDAADTSTMQLDANNRVLKWYSKSSNGFAMEYYGRDTKTFSTGERPTLAPFLQSDGGYLSKPAVVFGTVSAADTSMTGTVLYASGSTQLKHRTCFFVTRTPASGYFTVGSSSGANLSLWNKKESTGNAVALSAAAIWEPSQSELFKNGYAWLDGTLAYDHDTLNAAFGTRNTACLLVTEASADQTFEPMIGGGYIAYWRYWRGPISEVLVYDRVLSDAERALVTAYLQDKWMGGATESLWKGADGDDWHTAANWIPAKVPGAASEVDLLGGKAAASAGIAAKSVSNGTLAFNVAGGEAALADTVLGEDVNVVKQGEGTLALSTYQTYAGTTTLEGGTFAATNAVTIDSMEGLTVHLDASRLDTFTLGENREVTEWRSTVGGAVFKSPSELPAESVAICDYTPYLHEYNGLTGVRFGYTQDNVQTGSYLKATSVITNQTIFIVNRQERSNICAILGRIDGTGGRITGSNSSGNTWSDSSVWVNGADTRSFKNSSPHLLMLDRGTSQNFTMTLGVAWAIYQGAATTWSNVFDPGTIYELVIFDRTLTDEEKAAVQTWLMAKWNISPFATLTVSDTLSPNTDYTVKGDSTLDFGGMTQTIKSLAYDGTSGALPKLTVKGDLSLADTAFSLVNATKDMTGEILSAPDAEESIGSFKSEEGLLGSQKLRYRAKTVSIFISMGLFLILR